MLRFLLICAFLSACGYRWQHEYPNKTRPSLSVPFVKGDEEGVLTAEIISAFNRSGLVEVIHRGGEYRLEITILNAQTETVGYRRDRQQINGKSKKNLLACEGRKTIELDASLYKSTSDQIAYGPYRIAVDADYDYVDGDSIQDLSFVGPAGVFTVVLPFSLGQLESNEAAQEAAMRPLYRKIAQKIVDVISSEW